MTLLLSLPAISSPLLDKIINYLKGARTLMTVSATAADR